MTKLFEPYIKQPQRKQVNQGKNIAFGGVFLDISAARRSAKPLPREHPRCHGSKLSSRCLRAHDDGQGSESMNLAAAKKLSCLEEREPMEREFAMEGEVQRKRERSPSHAGDGGGANTSIRSGQRGRKREEGDMKSLICESRRELLAALYGEVQLVDIGVGEGLGDGDVLHDRGNQTIIANYGEPKKSGRRGRPAHS